MRTSPIIEIMFNETLTLDAEDIINATLIEETKAIGSEIPASVLQFTIYSDNEEFSIFGGDYYNQLSTRIPVRLYADLDGEIINMGQFYVKTWKNLSAKLIEFEAVDIIGLLESMDYDGSFWSELTPAATVIETVLNETGVPYEIDSALQSVDISGWIPQSDYRYALQQICLAAGAYATTSRTNKLKIAPIRSLPTRPDKRLIYGQQGMESQITLQPALVRLELIAHDFTASEEQETIFEGTLPAGFHKIIFEKPYYNVEIPVLAFLQYTLATEDLQYEITTEDGGFILVLGEEMVTGSNCVYLYLQDEEIVTVTGYPYEETLKSYIYTAPDEVSAPDKVSIAISDATMINTTSAQAIMDRLVAFYSVRYVQDLKVMPQKMVSPGMVISSLAIDDKRLLGFVEKSSIDLSKGMIANISVLGAELVPLAYRYPRTNVAVTNTSLTRQDGFR